jgi:hypothetical protein
LFYYSYCYCNSYCHCYCLLPLAFPPLGITFAGSDTPLHLPSQVRSSRSKEDRDCPRGPSSPTRPGHFQGLHPLGAHPGNAPPRLIPIGIYFCFAPGAFPLRPFPRIFASLGPGPRRLLLQGLCPTGHLSAAWTSLCFHHPSCSICTRMA